MKNNLEKPVINPGGFGEVFTIAFPLILSTSAFTLQLFIDRVFLMWYDRDAMSAAMLGGILNFVAFSFFMGTANYVNTFVSQYDGAGRAERIGPAVWQSLYFSAAAGLIMVFVSLFGEPLMDIVGHDAAVRVYEVKYFRILAAWAMPGLFTVSLSCFYTGRGRTMVVMWVNIVRTCVNITMDYILIFGKLGMPEMGISGAAIATISSGMVSTMIYVFLFLAEKNRSRYETSSCRFDRDLFKRLMRFGLPNGTQFMLEMLGFALFIVLIGRIDSTALAATSMACNINLLSFLPMIGFGIATSTLVGRALGKNDPALAQKSTFSASIMTFGYMSVVAVCYFFVPDVFMLPYKFGADAAQFEVLKPLVSKLLIFVAFYCLFDTGNIIFSAAIKGAGDTRFVMITSVVLNWTMVVVPTYLAVRFLDGRARLYGAWTAFTLYVCALSVIFFLRFLGGKWKSMRVIEKAPVLPDMIPAIPTVEDNF
ncbi:MAG: MATE family efflux transporter [Sedimentisphaerales bacterium]|nr:MATE family efflux transporter [Sedimentisphaerales bacterium]